MEYPNVNLPDYYTLLLKSNLQATGTAFDNLRNYIFSNKSFYSIVEHSFKHIDSNIRIDKIIKSLGWFGFRDSLAAVFVEHQMSGKFPDRPNRELVKDIIAFEDYLKKFTVAGYSRGFLLAFYIKMSHIKLKQTGGTISPDSLEIGFDLIDLLKNAKAKTIKIDWLLLILNHADNFLGRDKLIELLDKKVKYDELYQYYSESQKKAFVGNLLSYGSSIGEGEIFFSKTV